MKIDLTCLVLSVALVVCAFPAGAGRYNPSDDPRWVSSSKWDPNDVSTRVLRPRKAPALSSEEASKAEASPKRVAPTCVRARRKASALSSAEAAKNCWLLSMRSYLKTLDNDRISKLRSQEASEVKDFSAEKAPPVALNVPPFSSHGDPVVHFNENVWGEHTYCANPENFTSDDSMTHSNPAGDSESYVIQGHTFLPGGAIASSPEDITLEEMCIDSEDLQLGYDFRVLETLVSDEDFMDYFLTSEKSQSAVSTESNAR